MTVLDDRIPTLLARVDLAAEVERRAGPGRRSGSTVTFPCPHPDHEDRTPSFTVDVAGARAGTWRCWSRCAAGGDLIDLVVWLDHLSKAEAIEQLARRAGLERTPREQLPAQAWDVVRGFVADRGWHPGVVSELGIRPARRSGHLVVRFPIRRNGAEVSYQDRQLGGRTPKWLNPRGPIPCPFEADRIAIAHQVGELVVAEGVSDTVALLSDFPDAAVIGCPGAGVFKREWAAALDGLVVFVVADNDPAGEAMRERVAALAVGADVCQVQVPEPHHDLDDWRQATGPGWHELAAELLAEAGSAQ